MLRRLRIAASVFFAVLAVALCVLWGASYWRFVVGQGRLFDMNSFSFNALDGSLTIYFVQANHAWEFTSWEASGFPAMRQQRDPTLPYTFRVSSNASALTIQAPLWFPAMMCGLSAAAPWLPIRWRFSLRALLIATTLVAVVLGLVCYTVG